MFRSQLQLLLQIRQLITPKVESSLIRIDSNSTENIIWKVVNVSVGPRMEVRKTPALTGYCFLAKIIHPKPLKAEIRLNTRPENSIRLKLVKMPNPVERPGYIKCRSSSSPRHIKNPISSVIYTCQKICSWSDQENLKPCWK